MKKIRRSFLVHLDPIILENDLDHNLDTKNQDFSQLLITCLDGGGCPPGALVYIWGLGILRS